MQETDAQIVNEFSKDELSIYNILTSKNENYRAVINKSIDGCALIPETRAVPLMKEVYDTGNETLKTKKGHEKAMNKKTWTKTSGPADA